MQNDVILNEMKIGSNHHPIIQPFLAQNLGYTNLKSFSVAEL